MNALRYDPSGLLRTNGSFADSPSSHFSGVSRGAPTLLPQRGKGTNHQTNDHSPKCQTPRAPPTEGFLLFLEMHMQYYMRV